MRRGVLKKLSAAFLCKLDRALRAGMRSGRSWRDAGDVDRWSARRVADGGGSGNIGVRCTACAGSVTNASIGIVGRRWDRLRMRGDRLLGRWMLLGIMNGGGNPILLESKRVLEDHFDRRPYIEQEVVSVQEERE